MSNTDFEGGDAFSNVVSADAYRARNFAVTAVEDDPEKAAQAVKLGDFAGVAPAAVLADFDEFKLAQRRKTTEDLIHGSPALQDYINSHPLAAKVSNDDLDKLDEGASTLRQWHEAISPERHLATAAKFGWGFLKGFDQATTSDKLAEKFGEMNSDLTVDQWKWVEDHPKTASLLFAVKTIPEVGVRSLSAVFGVLQEGAVEGVRQGATEAGAKNDGGMFSPDRLAKGVGELTQFAMDTVGAKPHVVPSAKLHFDSHVALAAERARPFIERGEDPPAGLHPFIDEMKAEQAKTNMAALAEAERQANGSATRERAPEFYENFIRQQGDMELGITAEAVRKLYGDKPLDDPAGPLAHVPGLREQTELAETYGGDVTVPLSKWLAYTDPEVMKGLRDNVRVGKRGVTLEEAKATEPPKTAGEPLPEAGLVPAMLDKDGTIWVGKVGGQHFEISEAHGKAVREKDGREPGEYTWQETGFVTPEGQFLDRTKALEWVDKNEKKIRPSENMEGELDALDYRDQVPAKRKYRPAPRNAVQPSIDAFEENVNAVRELAQVGPLDRKLQLNRVLQKKISNFGPEQGFHDFEMLDQDGKPVGYVNISLQRDGKDVYIDMIEATGGLKPQDLGPRLMRDLLIRQIGELFPEAERVGGYRVSGAREAAGGKYADMWLPLRGRKAIAISDGELAQLFVPKGWDSVEGIIPDTTGMHDVGMGTKARNVDEATATPEQTKLIAAVDELLSRITPQGVRVQPVEGIVTASGQQPRGLYSMYKDAEPAIRYLIDGPDALGTVRHEAIHHLRRYGFFSPAEWSLLERSARQGGWLEKHGITERYPDADMALKLEEGIAEEYKTWAQDPARYKGPTAEIFQRLKELMEWVKKVLSETFGKDVTADEVFAAVEQGFIGERRGTKPLDERAFQAQKVAELPDDWTVKVTKRGSHMMDPESNYRNVEIKSKSGTSVADVTLRPYKGGYSIASITNNSKWLNEGANYKPGLGERAYVEAAKAAHAEGKKLFAGTDETSDFARGAHARLEEQGYASKPDADGVVEIYPEPQGKQMMQVVDEDMAGYDRVNAEAPAPDNRPGDRPPFATAKAFGSTERNAQRYAQLIGKRNAEDFAKAMDRAEKQEKREQTAEWKQNYAAMREETAAQLDARPDIAAINLLRDRKWLGERMEHAVKIDPETLPLDLREAFPKDLTAADGMGADALGQMLGYPDARSLADAVIRTEISRKVEGLTWDRWRNREVKVETDRRMAQAYGDLGENIRDAAMDQALSATQMELLHEETMARAAEAGAEYSITKDQMVAWAREKFRDTPAKGLKAEQYLTAAGRAWRKVEDALLANKPLDAFRAKQQQFAATLMAKEAHAFERDQARLDRLLKRYAKREGGTAAQAYTNYIQQLMHDAGLRVRRSPNDIALGIAEEGYGSLGQFAEAKNADGGEVFLPDWLQQGQAKAFEEMTVQERLDFHKALRTLDHTGREENKITVAGEKADRDVVINGIVERIRSAPRKPHPEDQGKLRKWLAEFRGTYTRPEMMIRKLDQMEELGPLYKALFPDMVESKAHEYGYLEGLASDLKAMKKGSTAWQKTLGDRINHGDLFIDPVDGLPMTITRENMIHMMLNWGTRSSREKFARGWASQGNTTAAKDVGKAFEAKLEALIYRKASAEDWDFVQGIWDIFDKWRPDIDVMYRRISGVAPEWLAPERISTRFGEIDGKYYPVIYDPYYGMAGMQKAPDYSTRGVFDADYVRPTTNNNYTISRTGFIGRVQFKMPLDMVAARMGQTIHDLAFRESIMNASKIVYDKKVQLAIRQHHGESVNTQLQSWLKRTANEGNMNERELGPVNNLLQRFRLNLVSHALPFNLNMILSPDVGTANLNAMFNKLGLPFTKRRAENKAFVLENSREVKYQIYNMDRDFKEHLAQTLRRDLGKDVSRAAVEKGYWLATKFSQEFRMATWLDKYTDEMDAGKTHIDAVHLADMVVRERHGGAHMMDLPTIMTKNEVMKSLTLFYGYLNVMQNWMESVPSQAATKEWKKAAAGIWGTILVGAAFNKFVFQKEKEKDTQTELWARAFGGALTQGIPFVREPASYLLEGFNPRTPIAGATVAGSAAIGDLVKAWQNKPVKKPITHAANAVGALTGLPLGQLGKTSQFIYDEQTNKQHPRDFMEYLRGLKTGEARLPKR